MLIRKSLLSDIGLIREDFLRYYNDVELSFRARECGWQTTVCRKAIIMHRTNLRKINPHRLSIPPYPYVYRDSIFFAKIRKKFVLKAMLPLVVLGKIKTLFKEGYFMDSFKVLLTSLKIALCVLLTPIKPIPRLET
jgi:GT2 family glycosyltransferase